MIKTYFPWCIDELQTLLVLVALAAFVFAEEMEVQDQEAAELYYRNYGVVSLKNYSKASVERK